MDSANEHTDPKKYLGKTLNIRVIPKASHNKITIETSSDGTEQWKIYITTVPEGGKANKAVINLLSKELGIPKSSFQIIRGIKSKDKVIQILN